VGFCLCLALALAPLSAAFAAEASEIDTAEMSPLTAHFYSEFVRAFLNNEYLLRNIELIAIAAERYEGGFYNEAFEYAQEAMRYAQMSDDYIALQMRIREADNAISSARFRLEWAGRVGIPTRYPETFERAQSAFDEALLAREREGWEDAAAFALRVLYILSDVVPALPAQFLVGNWAATRDCLWNIAALPEVFGDPTRWPLLYEANRDRMPSAGNPDLILPGMILNIPSIAGEVRYGLMTMD